LAKEGGKLNPAIAAKRGQNRPIVPAETSQKPCHHPDIRQFLADYSGDSKGLVGRPYKR